MNVIGLLVKALIQENPYDLLVENRKYLEFANTALEDGDHSNKALHALLVYAEKHKKCPKNIETLLRYVITNTHHVKEFSKSDIYDEQLRAIQEDETEVKESAESLIDEVYQRAFTVSTTAIYEEAGRIAAGATDNPYTKERGPAAATEYITEATANLVVKTPPEASGDLVENIDTIEQYINDFIIGDSKRVYTGFKHIDEITLIGRKQRNRWIGIMGYTHHGKSLFLTTMVYNMACRGANVMIVPRESSVEETWMSLVWLHHSKVCPDRPIPKREEWMRIGAAVGTEKQKTIKLILDDLRQGTSIPGKLVVYPCTTWEEIEDKLRATNKKNQYDVLAIDYFAHLETEGGKKNESDIDKHKRSLRKAQMMTLNGIENDKSGLVIVTPLQVNKKGYEEAAKREGDKYGIYESPIAVEWFTQAAQDMDLLMSVWFEGDSCTEAEPRKQMIIHCLKGRMNMKFPTHRLEIHPETGMLCDLNSNTETLRTSDRSADSLSGADMEDVMYTKVSVNADSWGM